MSEAALVTGASRGIGLELTRCLARDNRNCVIVSRSSDRLKEIKDELESRYGVSVFVLPKDLSEPGSSRELVEQLEGRDIHVRTLINNAGFGNYGRFDTHDWNRELELLQLNIVTLTELTRRLVEPMIDRGRGQILNVASTASFVPGPYMATYYASKAYVLSFGEALAEELSDTGVTVTTLCPGFTETGFQEAAGVAETGLVEKIPLKASPEAVAEFGYGAMKDGDVTAVHGFLNRLIVSGLNFVPRSVVRTLLGVIQGGPFRNRSES